MNALSRRELDLGKGVEIKAMIACGFLFLGPIKLFGFSKMGQCLRRIDRKTPNRRAVDYLPGLKALVLRIS